MEGICR